MLSSSFFLRALVVLTLVASARDASAQDADPSRNPVPVPVAGMGFAGFGGAGGGVAVPGGSITIVSTGPIPANGAVLVLVDRAENASITASPLDGATTMPVSGTLTHLEGAYWVWRPDSPLVPGTTYMVEGRIDAGAEGSFVSVQATLLAREAIELHTPALHSDPAISWVSQLIGQVCCQMWTQVGIELGACAPTSQRASVQLTPGLSSPEPQALLGQFLYRIWPAGADRESYAFNPWGVPMVLELSEQADAYCYEIETLAFVGGERVVHEALEPRCVRHGDAPPIGETMLELPEDFLERQACHEPPATLAETWCELNDACEAEANDGCVLYGYLCNDEPLPTWSPLVGDSGMVLAGTGGGGERDAGDDAGPTGGVASLDGGGGTSGGGSDGGCSVARPARSRASWLITASVLLAGMLGVRRRVIAC